MTGAVDVDAEPAKLGAARRVREGDDLTIVSWSGALRAVAAATELLAGISLDIIDLRTIYPWDREMVFASVRRTGRLLVVHEAVTTGGFGGEIAATVAEELFASLKAPVRRLGAPRIPVPYSPPLEDVCKIAPQRIAEIARELVAYRR